MSVRVDTLPNGMRVASDQMEGLGSTTLGIWVDAGCRHESPRENGVAHFLEHMAFKGTETRSAAEIAVAIENVGGYLNAYTSRETTAYYARVLAEDAPLAAELIADILRAPRFDDAELAVERGVILQEIGQALDTPDDVIFDWLQEVSYPDQAMGRPILGPAEHVSGFTADDLRRFTGAHYAPERVIFAAAGDVDHDAMLTLADALFGDMRASPRREPEGARFLGGERRELKSLEQAHLALNFESPSCTADDYFAAQAFSIALGGGMSSRLFQEAREKRGLCYSVFAQASGYKDTGCFTLYAGTGRHEARPLAELMVDELRIAAENMSDEEIARARAQMKAGLVMGLESPSNRAERLARSLAIWGEAEPTERVIERIEAVDAQSARAVAQTICANARPAVALYGPVADAPGADEVARRLAA